MELSVEWTIGDQLLDTDSLNVDFIFPMLLDSKRFEIPLYIRYHKGPMDTLANYTREQDSFGFGLRFSALSYTKILQGLKNARKRR